MAGTHFNGPVYSENGFIGEGTKVNVSGQTISTITTAGVATYSAAQMLGGLILRDPNGAARSDVTSSAALLAAAILSDAGDVVDPTGLAFEFVVVNTADASEVITVTGGNGATPVGTMTIAQSASKRFRVIFTSATAYSIYNMGTFTS